jgi:anti-sigma regulatory factor (Ser/Thr protein kinase)
VSGPDGRSALVGRRAGAARSGARHAVRPGRRRRRLAGGASLPASRQLARPVVGAVDARLPLPADPRAVRAARGLVRDACELWGLPRACDDAELLVSEIVTNAVVHARGDALVVVVRPARAGLRVEVHDGDPHALQRRRPAPDALGGRGLQLVGELADAWGVERRQRGKAVWFELTSGRRAG